MLAICWHGPMEKKNRTVAGSTDSGIWVGSTELTSVCRNKFREIYVPFVDPTEARNDGAHLYGPRGLQ
jgi:hypothetical protein